MRELLASLGELLRQLNWRDRCLLVIAVGLLTAGGYQAYGDMVAAGHSRLNP